jgi:hypothetical protein
MYADVLIGGLTMVLQMDKIRQVCSDSTATVSTRSLRAARMILDTLVTFDDVVSTVKGREGISIYGITFWPFRAFFTLYYHIIYSSDPVNCQHDLERLEKLGVLLEKAAHTRFQYVPVANAARSLNQVARHVQEERLRRGNGGFDMNEEIFIQDGLTQWPCPKLTVATAERGQLNETIPLQAQQPQWPGTIGFTGAQVQTMNMETSSEFESANMSHLSDPVLYAQAIEDEFTAGLWNCGWWDSYSDGAHLMNPG